MKVVTEEIKAAANPTAGVANGFTRLFNKLDGSTVDVHNVDAREYLAKLPHLWSNQPVSAAPVAPVVSKEQAAAVDAEIVPEPVKSETVAPIETAEDKPISARSRKLAKFED